MRPTCGERPWRFTGLPMLFAMRQDRLGFLLIDQIKSKVGGNVAKRERHQGPPLQAMIHAFGVGIRNVVRQCDLGHPIRFPPLQLFPPELEAHYGGQMEKVGRRDLGADLGAKRGGFGGVSNRQLDFFQPLGRCAGQRSFHRGLLVSLVRP